MIRKMKRINQKKIREFRFQTIIEIIMLILLVFSFIPVFLMAIMSFKSNVEIYNDYFALPKRLAMENYDKAFTVLEGNMLNTLFVVLVAVVLTLVLSALGGFAFATMNFPGKGILWFGLLALMMIPGILSLAPRYDLIQRYGLFNTRWALILPWATGGQVLGIILCRNSIEGLPGDLFEAAKIEGCGVFKCLTKIAVPLSKPILSTVAVLKMVDYYNDFIWPLLVIEDNKKQVVTVAVRVFNSAQGVVNVGAMFAGFVIATIPMFIMFIFTSRLYMEGMTAGAVKG